MKAWKIAALMVGLAACASKEPVVSVTPPRPPAMEVAPLNVDPVGNYEFVTTVQEQQVTGTMTVTGSAGSYTGKILTSMFPEMPVLGATVNGQNMIVKTQSPDGEILLHFKFEGNAFTGHWEFNGQPGGTVSGKKLK
jgi:hypothetical protein